MSLIDLEVRLLHTGMAIHYLDLVIIIVFFGAKIQELNLAYSYIPISHDLTLTGRVMN